MADLIVNSDSQHLLLLRVMRLARPKLNRVGGFAADPLDSMGDLIEQAMNIRNGELSQNDAVGQLLVAPQMFENIYLGETFTFYVNCVNESDQRVSNVVVKCELQTNSQRAVLPCSVSDLVLEAGKSTGQLISHEVKEIGQHILICSVNYSTPMGEKMYFRKFFKFPVTKPIDVKTKFYNTEDSLNSDVYLEAQIENTAAIPMMLDTVCLESTPIYSVSPIKNDMCLNEYAYDVLNPHAIRQFLFRLSLKQEATSTFSGKDLKNIGKIDISWKTNLGERGRLQTSALQRNVSSYSVRLSIDECPAVVVALNPFSIKCRLHNLSDKSMDLTLLLDSSASALVLCSTSGVSLGNVVLPGGSVSFTLDILPATVGFQTVTGVSVRDNACGKTYPLDEIAHIFVLSS